MWPQLPICWSTTRMKISLPECGCRSITTGRRFSLSKPETLKKTFCVSARTSSTRVSSGRTAADEKAGERLRHLNGTDVRVPVASSPAISKAADPIIAGVLALHVRPALMNGVAFDRLPVERLPFGLPVFQRAVFKVEVERFAVAADGGDARPALRRRWQQPRLGRGKQE